MNLGFHRGSELEDPEGVLQGTGRLIRHIRIAELEDLAEPAVRAFVNQAIAPAKRPAPDAPKSKSVVRAIYARKAGPQKGLIYRPANRQNSGISKVRQLIRRYLR